MNSSGRASTKFRRLRHLLRRLTRNARFVVRLSARNLGCLDRRFLLLVFSHGKLCRFRGINSHFCLLCFTTTRRSKNRLTYRFRFSMGVRRIYRLFFHVYVGGVHHDLSDPYVRPRVRHSIRARERPTVLIVGVVKEGTRINRRPVSLAHCAVVARRIVWMAGVATSGCGAKVHQGIFLHVNVLVGSVGLPFIVRPIRSFAQVPSASRNGVSVRSK